ncbi:phosphoglycerate dehydrogenase [Bacillus sp. AFS055030]|uniref:phosphoglycerate dehydrogenase n=1 Tax=Bacillus sp. AFS055030 TaxID=2033507 RepID=UPI000BFDDE89|nr:phosphoglycerate dehydrogenase [Bacillus sp. AFS055030]PGL70993.1 hydroxyacid dehydrogenase [Bacillus sp. AFS055030]
MKKKVLVTPRSFGKHSTTPIQLLENAGYEVQLNRYNRILTKAEMKEAIQDVDGVIIGVDPLDKEVLMEAKNLKAIAKYGVGTDNIDLDYADKHQISVSITAGANSNAVADYTMSLMLSVARRVATIDYKCRQKDWSKITTVDAYGKTLGLIGTGNIGKGVAKRAKGFDMKILAYDLVRDEEFAKEHGITYVESVNDILQEADFISLHLPLNNETRHIISYEEFQMMKPTAVIINTARGGLINEDALENALKNKLIWGAGIDVFEQEPPINHGLLLLDNIVIGSHCAASTIQAIDNMGIYASQNLLKSLELEGAY